MSEPFPPDAALPLRLQPSPNHGERRGGARPDMILLHYTGMPDAAEAIARLCSPASEVSAHYVVLEDGGIVQCVAEARRAWHAGPSTWGGVTDINSHAIGIEIANPGHEHGYLPFPDAQIAAVIALCRDILARHRIPPHRVLAHSDVAPTRKMDPGEKFPWERLHEAGIGDWTQPIATHARALQPGACGRRVAALQQDLAAYGYGIDVTARYDEQTGAVVRAFQRHFRPHRVDGIADAGTQAMLAGLRERQARRAAAAAPPVS